MKLSVRMRSSRALELAEYFIATAIAGAVDISPRAWARAWAGARAAVARESPVTSHQREVRAGAEVGVRARAGAGARVVREAGARPSSEAVVDMGASSVPPSVRKASSSLMPAMPR